MNLGECGGLFHHEASEGDDVKTCECFGIAFIVFDKASEAGCLGE